jgi:hypothetical protein
MLLSSPYIGQGANHADAYALRPHFVLQVARHHLDPPFVAW